MYKQFLELTAKRAFSLKYEGARGRACLVNIGDIFTITNPSHMQGDAVKLSRKRGAKLNTGYSIPTEMIEQLFEVIED
jgi:hypothetical protein